MITLRKVEQVEIYQVELALKEKTKQSPFIAVLILAQEQGEIDVISLKTNLLPILPERACENLLKRLAKQGYLYEEEYGSFSSYSLTELGEQSAIDKSYWVGEKGLYDVYISKKMFDDGFIPYHILKIEKSKTLEDNRNKISSERRTPQEISAYKSLQIKLNNQELLLEEIESKCFLLNPMDCFLEIQSSNDESFLRILKDKQTLFQSSFETNEHDLKEELLTNSKEYEFEENKKVVLSNFNQDNLSFNRKVKLINPYFQDNQFNSVEIENVAFIPSNKRNAELWLNEILFKGIDKYFLDKKMYNEFTANKAKPILEHYSVELPTREQLKQTFAERENAFYQIAKLETIDFLNY